MLESLAKDLKVSRAFEAEMRKFADVLTADKALQNRLTEAVDGGIGRNQFRDLYVAMAAENGIQFSSEEMEIAMQEQKQGKDKILPSFVQKLVSIL